MEKKQSYILVKIVAAVTFALMLAVNILADIIPIGGATTRQIADKYDNLFTPTPFTFSIWGVIYLMLALYTLYLLGFFRGKEKKENTELLKKTGILFSVTNIANALWIIAWHYDKIALSVVIMLVLLVALILINRAIKKDCLTLREKFFIDIPFSVYFGWITVATIANITALLVSLGWNGFGISEVIWTIIILLVGTAIGMAVIIINRDIAYGLVMIWAYSGILIKHISTGGFNGQYPPIIVTAAVCLILFSIAISYVLISEDKKKIC